MGIHFGVVAADVPSVRLIDALDAIAPRFSDRGALASLDDLDPSGESEWELAVGDVEGRSCIADGTFMLSSDADLIARVAASTRGLVIGCGAESVSGMFYLVAARSDELLRHYFQSNSDLTKPYSSGAPLTGESGVRLDDSEGDGLIKILAANGVDYERWLAHATKRRLAWSADHLGQDGPLPWAGSAEAALERHRSTHRLAPGAAPAIKLASGPPNKKPWWRFW